MSRESTQNPPRFIFVNRYYDPDQSATGQMLTDLARGLSARGLRVHVVCSRQLYTNAAAQLLSRETRAGVIVRRVGTSRFGRSRLLGRVFDYASFFMSAGFALMRIVRAGDVVIAKTDPPLISVLAAMITRIKGAALVNWQQDVFPEVAMILGASPLPLWLHSILQDLRDSSTRRAAVNVVIGNRMREFYHGRGISESKLRVIENWADGDLIRPMRSECSTLRASLGFTDQFVVGYSGNLGRAHEFETLLAAAEIVRSDPAIVFLMIGGGAKMEPLRSAVKERALGSFRFLPYQERSELADSLAAADAHLVSLLPVLEGLILPSKLYGILAAGRPLLFVGDLRGDIARTIDEAACGVSVNINASAELAAAIRMLQSDRDRCLMMGARARQAFLQRHTLEMAVDKWMSVLDLAVQERSQRMRL